MKNTQVPILLAASALMLSCTSKEESPKPNIVLINIDDMGWKDVGFMGSKFYETPNIDSLANNGMVFTQAYAGAANCAPSRACLMSGQWTTRHGIYTVDSSERGRAKDRKLIPVVNETVLPDRYYILSEALKDAGYLTCHSGKWHLNDDPTSQGFDVNIGGCHSGNPGSYFPPYTKVPLDAPTDDKYLTDLIMDHTLEFVDSVKSPFFLYYSLYAVHTPIQPVDSLLYKYENKAPWQEQNNKEYATMVENLDRNIGRLVALLKKKKLIDNTIILFISDNGGVYGVTKQRPLRAGKGAYYEGGIREPMFVYWKDVVSPGSVCDEPVTNLDFYPTLLDAVGIVQPKGLELDGTSIMPLLTGTGILRDRALYWHFPIYLQAGNNETQDKLFRTRPGSAIRYKDWKLIQYFENNDIELYNLKDDIGESNNITTLYPEVTEMLLKMLDEWRVATNAPIPKELNPEYKQ